MIEKSQTQIKIKIPCPYKKTRDVYSIIYYYYIHQLIKLHPTVGVYVDNDDDYYYITY